MAISRIKAVFACDVRTLWDAVTSLENYSWRGDISRIEILSEKQFVEFTKNGYKTVFTITAAEPCKRWEFDLENEKIKGHWTGLFAPKEDGAELDFTENGFCETGFHAAVCPALFKKTTGAVCRRFEKSRRNECREERQGCATRKKP